ncbi:MAG TPA: (Fe-S)-binding protein [Actinomycetota bacterium]|jgi:glycolate oxidase iron-sulfur subunit|nr:(Fe-S)-binding protein [Actinomycetota bacterium]
MPTSNDRPPIGAELPDGARFIGPESGAVPGWLPGDDHPSEADLASCVACGLCLPHCPTYRLTGEESASPRGRIAAMRAVAEGTAVLDDTFTSFMDLCLSCRACEDVCPSHVPFGRMMERARVQIEPLRSRRARFLRWLGLDVVLPRKRLLWLAIALQPVARPFLPKRIRALVPRGAALFSALPRVTPATGAQRGTVALLAGCVQDRWFREVNLATIRVLARNGWRVVVPRAQRCCGALPAHYGRLGTARSLARANARAFANADRVIVNAAGCGAHMKEYGELLEGAELPVRDLMEFLHEEGLREAPGELHATVAYHDACHALRAQRIREQPRHVLRQIPGLTIAEIPNGDRCCGAAGLYNVLEPAMSGDLRREKAEAIASTGATTIASANPGCSMQLAAGLAQLGVRAEVVHPIQLLDRAYPKAP